MYRLGSTAARLKLKEIDGGPHKRRSMWLNSMQREEPYLDLTSLAMFLEIRTEVTQETGAAWLSSVRAVRCLVKSSNERNPCDLLLTSNVEDSSQTACLRRRKVGTTSSQYGPYI